MMTMFLNSSITELIHMGGWMGYKPAVYTSAFSGFTPIS